MKIETYCDECGSRINIDPSEMKREISHKKGSLTTRERQDTSWLGFFRDKKIVQRYRLIADRITVYVDCPVCLLRCYVRNSPTTHPGFWKEAVPEETQ